jgi:hypothetical protein
MNLNHKAGESVESRLENHWKRMDAIVSVQERLEDEFYARLASLESGLKNMGIMINGEWAFPSLNKDDIKRDGVNMDDIVDRLARLECMLRAIEQRFIERDNPPVPPSDNTMTPQAIEALCKSLKSTKLLTEDEVFPPSECEHQWEFICSTSGTDDPNIYETYRCQKCLSQESRVIKPTPSSEPECKPKEAPHTKECNDRCKRDNHVTCTCHVEPKCEHKWTTGSKVGADWCIHCGVGKPSDEPKCTCGSAAWLHSQNCEAEPTISISRKVASRWADVIDDIGGTWSMGGAMREMYDEVRRAIGRREK